MRALVELYADVEKREIKTPAKISRGEFANLHYQLDAIRQGLKCLENYDGVMIADVVGLGKSIIAAAIAYNLAMPRTIIIAPPHLKRQWEKYAEKFSLHEAMVESSGKLDKIYDEVAASQKTTLYIIDEAHRYRNENTAAYRKLHQITRSHPENKVMLLTATPYNNHPRDIYALVKLFQIPSRATLNVVDNLGLRFGQLIAEYNQLEKLSKHEMTPEIERQLSEIAQKMRMIIEPMMIRRSRIDLTEVSEYAEDLARQKISFAKVNDPKLMTYDLGERAELYYQTLAELNAGEFVGAKYKPLIYLKDATKFSREYDQIFSFNRTQQMNMAKLARRLFVLRFESSQYAFQKTLENMIMGHETTMEMWRVQKQVPISKSKTLDKLDGVEDDNFTIPCELLNVDFMDEMAKDVAWLKKIYKQWFGNDTKFDPKQEKVGQMVERLLQEQPERKIVIFTSFADTAQAVTCELQRRGLTRTLLYTSTGNQTLKNTVTQNFDASIVAEEQADDYDIIVATDALSEGFNLHRAGVIINYDIPYNPTRVVQRVGRINRIDQRKFEELKIYNLFPTVIGEKVVNLKNIASLKMLLMNSLIGNDTKILTADEEIESFFQQQYHTVSQENENAAWDNQYRNWYDEKKRDTELMNSVRTMEGTAKIVRRKKLSGIISLAVVRRGRNVIFMTWDEKNEVKIITPERGLEILQADENEVCMAGESSGESEKKFREKLARPYELPKMLGNRGMALDVIEALQEVVAEEKVYLAKLHDVVRKYDDLCEAELHIITQADLNNVIQTVRKLKTEIPEWYLAAIHEKAERVGTTRAEIILIEDFV